MSGNLSKSAFFVGGWVILSADFRGKGASPTNHCWCQKTAVIALLCGIKISAVYCLVLSQSMRVTDRRTDTITIPKTNAGIAASRGTKNCVHESQSEQCTHRLQQDSYDRSSTTWVWRDDFAPTCHICHLSCTGWHTTDRYLQTHRPHMLKYAQKHSVWSQQLANGKPAKLTDFSTCNCATAFRHKHQSWLSENCSWTMHFTDCTC